MTDDEIRDADGCEDYESLEESGLHEEQTEAEEDAAAEELFSETDDGEPDIVEEPDAAEQALQAANENIPQSDSQDWFEKLQVWKKEYPPSDPDFSWRPDNNIQGPDSGMSQSDHRSGEKEGKTLPLHWM